MFNRSPICLLLIKLTCFFFYIQIWDLLFGSHLGGEINGGGGGIITSFENSNLAQSYPKRGSFM